MYTSMLCVHILSFLLMSSPYGDSAVTSSQPSQTPMDKSKTQSSRSAIVRHYEGSRFGVSAKATLDLSRRYARVSLSGLVLGGTLEGGGWLQEPDPNHQKLDVVQAIISNEIGLLGVPITPSPESGKVVLDADLERRLARRGVGVNNASLNRKNDTLEVSVNVPIMGAQMIVLNRVDSLSK
jgi:hypothetical protein